MFLSYFKWATTFPDTDREQFILKYLLENIYCLPSSQTSCYLWIQCISQTRPCPLTVVLNIAIEQAINNTSSLLSISLHVFSLYTPNYITHSFMVLCKGLTGKLKSQSKHSNTHIFSCRARALSGNWCDLIMIS